MDELLSSGRLIDVALLAIALEMLVLLVLYRRRGGLHPADIFGHLLAGGLLLLAVRLEATGADRRWTLLLLVASFPVHLFDLVRRVRAARRME